MPSRFVFVVNRKVSRLKKKKKPGIPKDVKKNLLINLPPARKVGVPELSRLR